MLQRRFYTAGLAAYITLCDGSIAMTKRSKGFLLAFVLILGIGFGVAYMEREKSNAALFLEDCARRCSPRAGMIERKGFDVGPSWRPTSHNVVCTCK